METSRLAVAGDLQNVHEWEKSGDLVEHLEAIGQLRQSVRANCISKCSSDIRFFCGIHGSVEIFDGESTVQFVEQVLTSTDAV